MDQQNSRQSNSQIIVFNVCHKHSTDEPRTVRCPYCCHILIFVFNDTHGHIKSKCKSCGKESIVNVLSNDT